MAQPWAHNSRAMLIPWHCRHVPCQAAEDKELQRDTGRQHVGSLDTQQAGTNDQAVSL